MYQPQRQQEQPYRGMDTLHSPPSSPQQGSGPMPEYIPMSSYPQQQQGEQQTHGHQSSLNVDHNGNYLVSPTTPGPHSRMINHAYTYPPPPLSSLPSPGLPPPGTEPPYTSAPNSPGFPPGPYNQPIAQPKPNEFPSQPGPVHTNTSYDHPTGSTIFAAPKTPVYTPGSLTGPNGHGVHAPGQIGHPNQQNGTEKYKHGFCNCFGDFGTCCLGYWCPCILYSKTYHRIKTIPNSNLNAFSACNLHCAGFCVLAPVSWVFTCLQRTRIRENYRLEGSVVGDCCKSYCCVVCTLVQDDREVTEREDERRKFAGPGNGSIGGDSGYKKNETMMYGK